MNIDSAARKIWDYMLLHHELKKSDAIMVLGSRDTRPAEYGAQLYLDGWAPVIIFSGSGSIHNNKPGREKFLGSTEADVYADIAVKMGIPKKSIVIENESQNTSDNFLFSIKKLEQMGLKPKQVIAVQKPYMERRVYGQGRKRWPEVELIVTSPPVPFEQYMAVDTDKEYAINAMVGDLQRVVEYPKMGYAIEQEVPADVLSAYEFLLSRGYTGRLLKL